MVRATNDIFAGAMSREINAQVKALGLPEGDWTKEQIIAQLEAAGQTDRAKMLAGMDLRPGQGVDFASVNKVLLIVSAIYLLSALLSWMQGFLMAGVVQRTVYRLRRDVDRRSHVCR